VTVIFCAEKHGLLVLKSTAKDIFIQSTFFAKPTTKKHVSSIPGEKLVPMPHTNVFFHPLPSLDPKKIHDSKTRIILLEVVYFTMMMF